MKTELTRDVLEGKVDALVHAFIAETGVPGMTVAVGSHGRLVFTRGYGSAMVDGATRLPMKASMRSSIGSVTKAAITGPAVYQLLRKERINPETRTLYGPNGLLGGVFDADIDKGIAKFAPDSSNWKAWYRKITLQHLLDHKAGFARTASKADAAAMFGVSEEELTHEQYHRYFLRTSALLYEPGTDSQYSNHGFGLFALIVKVVSGKEFADYVRDDYLKPMGLQFCIQRSKRHPDSCDAHNHAYGPNDTLKVLEFDESRLGLAAGGYRASAQDLVLVMRHLEQRYDWAEINRMGWFGSDTGRLEHNGRLVGGTASVVMFPDGHRTSSNVDLSRVHVAVATPISVQNGDIDLLARNIALQVPASDIEPSRDLWPQVLASRSCEYVRHGVPSREYQGVIEEAAKQGFQLDWIDGYTVNGELHFNAIFRAPKSATWVSHHNMTGTAYQEKFDAYLASGYSLVHVDSYASGGAVRYAAIWKKGAGAFTAYHNRTAAEHQAGVDDLTSQGWRPRVISVASLDGERAYTALYNKEESGSYEARSSLTLAEYQVRVDANVAAGRRLRYLNAHNHNGEVFMSAIWMAKPLVTALKAKHGLTADQYSMHSKQNLNAGFRTLAVTGYEQAGKARFAASWVR